VIFIVIFFAVQSFAPDRRCTAARLITALTKASESSLDLVPYFTFRTG
jgi:hypothetical protein